MAQKWRRRNTLKASCLLIEVVNVEHVTSVWDRCNMCMLFKKTFQFIAFCTVTKYTGETCKAGMSLYTLEVCWVF